MSLTNEMKAFADVDEALERRCGAENLEQYFIRPTKNAVELKSSLIRAFCKEHLVSFFSKRCVNVTFLLV